MSSIVHKVKEVLHSDNKSEQKPSQPEGTHGPHGSKMANAADPRVDSDRDHREALTRDTHDGSYTANDNYAFGSSNQANRTDGPATKTDGPHSSNLANKADPRVDSDRDYSRNMGMNPQGNATTGHNSSGLASHPVGTSTGHHTHGTTMAGAAAGQYGTDGPASRTAGPHSSNMANKADPLVDSDRDGSRNMGLNQGTTATSGLGAQRMDGPASTTAGPHSSNMANKADPFVDSDRDGSRNMGLNQGTTTTSGFGAQRMDGPASTTAGPHSSNLANKADPRVDSDLDGSRNMGMNQGTTTSTGGAFFNGGNTLPQGTTGTHTTSQGIPEGRTGVHNTHHHTGMTNTSIPQGTAGTHTGTQGISHGTGPIHSTNQADPLQTSHRGRHDMGHTGTTGGVLDQTRGSHAPGPAPNTAGPHKSDLLNKVDPRVDSDLDGSKTYGQNKTHAQPTTTTSMANKDPTDAAQVPPSVLQKHIGSPTVHHKDDKHDRVRRHSVSHQEQHRGL